MKIAFYVKDSDIQNINHHPLHQIQLLQGEIICPPQYLAASSLHACSYMITMELFMSSVISVMEKSFHKGR